MNGAVATAARRPATGALAPRPSAAPGTPGVAQCPKCGSHETRKVSLIYAEGLSTTRGSIVGAASGDAGLAVASLSGSQQSLLSRQMAPPPRKGYGIPGAIATVVALVVAMVLGGAFNVGGWWLVVLAAAAWYAVFYATSESARDFNTTEHPRLMRDWERRFLCRRCGSLFEDARA